MLDVQFGLAACLQACGRHEAAIASYSSILAAEPAHAEANYGLATLLAQLGRFDDTDREHIEALLRTLMNGTDVPEFRLAPPD